MTSDLRIKGEPIELQCGVTEAIEVVLLGILLADVILQVSVQLNVL